MSANQGGSSSNSATVITERQTQPGTEGHRITRLLADIGTLNDTLREITRLPSDDTTCFDREVRKMSLPLYLEQWRMIMTLVTVPNRISQLLRLLFHPLFTPSQRTKSRSLTRQLLEMCPPRNARMCKDGPLRPYLNFYFSYPTMWDW